MSKGDILNYYGKPCEVIESKDKHVLIMFEDGSKICTNKGSFINK